MPKPDPAPMARLRRTYRDYARHDMPAQGSPIYAEICARLADDAELGPIPLLAAPAFRTPNVLLAAVHHLLLAGADHPLRGYYSTVVGDGARTADDDLYPAFADFVRRHRPEIERLVTTRSTQTNEVGRSALLLPALWLVERAAGLPLAMLEVGASAGLNLIIDRYGYRVGTAVGGRRDSTVQLTSEARGELRPPLPAEAPAIRWRIGLDLNPLDVGDPDALAWLRALVWPEHRDRMALLDAAAALARPEPPTIVRGDLLADLPAVAAGAPGDAEVTVIGTSVIVYIDRAQRPKFVDLLREIASARGSPVWLVSVEAESVLASLGVGIGQKPASGDGESVLSLHRFEPGGASSHRFLARCHAHGRWIRWLDPATAAPA